MGVGTATVAPQAIEALRASCCSAVCAQQKREPTRPDLDPYPGREHEVKPNGHTVQI